MGMFTGIGASFGSYFGGADLEDAYGRAIEELRKFQATADTSLAGFRQKGQGLYDKAITALTSPEMSPDIAALRSQLITSIGSGLSPLAKLYMEDANRALEGRAVQTGNVRSGAIGLQRGELGRRVVADEFGRALGTLDILRRGDQMSAGMYMQGALGMAGNENAALNTLGGAVRSVAGAEIGKGIVEKQRAEALGSGIGGVVDVAAAFFTGGMSEMASKEGTTQQNQDFSWMGGMRAIS